MTLKVTVPVTALVTVKATVKVSLKVTGKITLFVTMSVNTVMIPVTRHRFDRNTVFLSNLFNIPEFFF